jgi:sugar phosphate isomerase/epimerase
MDRRYFIKNSSLAVASSLIVAPHLDLEKRNRFGIQLYSVRDDMKKDPLSTLKELAKMGYHYVEGYGYKNRKWQGEHDLTLMKTMLAEAGLTMPSAHFVLKSSDFDAKKGDFTDDFKRMTEDAVAVGQKYFVSSNIVSEDRKDLDAFKNLCDVMNKTGVFFKKNGLTLGYHNHEFEFDKLGEETLFDTMLKEVDAKNLSIQMDMGWAVYANQNPIDWFKKYPKRFELSHMKDGNKRGETANKHVSCIIGKGDVDFKAVMDNRKLAGLKMLIVEIEDYIVSPLADAKTCLDNFKKLV